MRWGQVLPGAVAACLIVGGASAARAETGSCNLPDTKVVAAYAVQGDQTQPDAEVELRNVIELKVEGLRALLDCLKSKAGTGRWPVLFLAGHPIKGLTPFHLDPERGLLRYKLLRTDNSHDAWASILGRPALSPRSISVNIGADESEELKSDVGVKFRVIPIGYLLLGLGFLAVLAAAFVWCAHNTNIIRDPLLNPVTGVVEGGRYSLGKTQAAWWFFIILASFILIASITGDFNSTLNGTALALLGIGGGTVLGSALIDASKDPKTEQKREVAESIAKDITRQEGNLDALKNQAETTSGDGKAVTQLTATLSQTYASLDQARQTYKRLTGQSLNLLQDLVSDANGVSFHRFQMVAWTLLLSFIFLKEVYDNLAMPNFDTMLLGLQGLSAGTYLGLKIPEPTVPRT